MLVMIVNSDFLELSMLDLKYILQVDILHKIIYRSLVLK